MTAVITTTSHLTKQGLTKFSLFEIVQSTFNVERSPTSLPGDRRMFAECA